MEYTVKQLADLAGVSCRLLRYYDQIGLLRPKAVSPAGYRLYGATEVDRLQQILFYRELGFELKGIGAVLDAPDFNALAALRGHRQQLKRQKSRIEKMIKTIDATIDSREKGETMDDKRKFEGLKQQLLDENEKKYGREIREKYGEQTVAAANKRFMEQDQADLERIGELERRMFELLGAAMDENNPSGEKAQQACELHKQWLMHYWDSYAPEAHYQLTKMYVDDPRFTEYYDKRRTGTAAFLNSAMKIFTNQ